jgi:NADPH2:quinone reductase
MFKATADEQRAAANDINGWLASGKLKARIAKEMPLSEAAAAHRLQEEKTLTGSAAIAGKIILLPAT